MKRRWGISQPVKQRSRALSCSSSSRVPFLSLRAPACLCCHEAPETECRQNGVVRLCPSLFLPLPPLPATPFSLLLFCSLSLSLYSFFDFFRDTSVFLFFFFSSR